MYLKKFSCVQRARIRPATCSMECPGWVVTRASWPRPTCLPDRLARLTAAMLQRPPPVDPEASTAASRTTRRLWVPTQCLFNSRLRPQLVQFTSSAHSGTGGHRAQPAFRDIHGGSASAEAPIRGSAHAASTSVRAKSSPLKSSGPPVVSASAYAKQSPKFNAAGRWPFPNRRQARRVALACSELTGTN